MALTGARRAPAAAPASTVPGEALAFVAAIATVAATVWAVTSADWSDGTGAALVAAVAAVVEAALLARSASGRAAAVVAAPVLSMLAVVPLTLSAMPADSGSGLLHVVHRYSVALTTGLLGTETWPFVVGLCGVGWLIGYWVGWMGLRERLGILAVVPCYAVLAINALNAPSLANVALPEAVAVGFSLVLVGRAHLGRLEAEWRRDRITALPGTESRNARIVSVSAVALLALALLAPPLTTRDLSGSLFHFGGSGSSGSGGVNHRSGAAGPGTIQFSAEARPGGPLVSTPQPVLTYTTDSPATIYLRVVNDNVFDQGNWLPDEGGSIADVSSPAGPVNRDRNQGDGGVVGPTISVQTTIVVQSGATGGSPLALFPGDPEASSRGGVATGVAVRSDGADQLATVDRFELAGGGSGTITTTGLVSAATADQLRAAGTDYPDWVRAFTTLQDGSPGSARNLAVIRDLANQFAAGATNPYDQATAIEQALRSPENFTYTLSPPPTPASSGLWPVTYFLLTSHRGYCQYFASAMGAMLRAIGIPARVVQGYGPGSVDDSQPKAKTLHVVTTSDAHTWVEAYFPHYGWLAFEPTPDGVYQPLTRSAGTGSVVPTPPPSSAPAPSAAPTPRAPQHRSGDSGAATVQAPPTALLVVVLALLVVGTLLVVGMRWLAHPRSLPGVWRRIGLVGVLLGVRRQPSETHAAFARRLAAAIPPDTTTLMHRNGDAPPGPRPVRARAADALTQIAVASGKAGFAPRGLDARESIGWHRAWDRLRHAVPTVVWRGLLARTTR